MRRAYEIPEIQEQEYKEEFVMKSEIRMNNKKRDSLFAVVLAIIFMGILLLSLVFSNDIDNIGSQKSSNPEINKLNKDQFSRASMIDGELVYFFNEKNSD